MLKPGFQLIVVSADFGILLRRQSTSSSCGHILEEDLQVTLEDSKSFLIEGIHLGPELLVLLSEAVEVGRLRGLAID